eukprot:s107_g22.t1
MTPLYISIHHLTGPQEVPVAWPRQERFSILPASRRLPKQQKLPKRGDQAAEPAADDSLMSLESLTFVGALVQNCTERDQSTTKFRPEV